MVCKNFSLFLTSVAPILGKIKSIGLKQYTISWFQPPLPKGQTIQAFYANYSTSVEVGKALNISRERKSLTIDVKFADQYTFEIQVETFAGRSDVASKSWFSHSGILCDG